MTLRGVIAHARMELILTLRRGESMLVAIGIPAGVLAFFSVVDVLPHDGTSAVDALVPRVLALSVMSSAMVSLGIATGFERQSGVLKRLGATPLGRPGLVAAKLAAVVVTQALQVAVVLATAVALGWTPKGDPVAIAGWLLAGTVAFAGIGLGLAGRLRAETNLAASNALFLVLMLFGGIVVPVRRLPAPIAAMASVLPSHQLAESLRGAAHLGLLAWAAGACALAVLAFRWE
ncbi:MAG TPA: ABC transporter permease [Actinomycetota bacterium]|nr:ABC transporter permease [Actinomycetota bacterium]